MKGLASQRNLAIFSPRKFPNRFSISCLLASCYTGFKCSTMAFMNLLLALTVAMFIPVEDLILFHSVDRKLYSLLVFDLYREPVECMQIMALWLWLERNSFHSIIKRILTLPPVLINDLADEAVVCLGCIYNPPSPFTFEVGTEIPLTQSLVKQEISSQFLQENRDLAIQELAKVDTEICSKVFMDLMHEAVIRNNRILFHQSQLVRGLGQLGFRNNNNNSNNNNNVNNNSEEERHVRAEDRAMFVTFSKGYPVAEWEVRDFFTRLYGDCIESFYMQEVSGDDEQPLFARVVFFRLRTIYRILGGERKAKFTINGKHVWMRKFVPKSKPRARSNQLLL